MGIPPAVLDIVNSIVHLWCTLVRNTCIPRTGNISILNMLRWSSRPWVPCFLPCWSMSPTCILTAFRWFRFPSWAARLSRWARWGHSFPCRVFVYILIIAFNTRARTTTLITLYCPILLLTGTTCNEHFVAIIVTNAFVPKCRKLNWFWVNILVDSSPCPLTDGLQEVSMPIFTTFDAIVDVFE